LKGRALSVAGLFSIFVFAVISALVITNTTQSIDASLALALNSDQGTYLSNLMILSSEYGREYFWIPVVAIMFLFGRKDIKLLAIELAALFVVGIAAGEILKLVYFRPRPFQVVNGINLRVPIETDSSFPSGHALIVSIGAIFSLSKFTGKIGKFIALLLTLEAGIVSYSRVYVGVHYPLDVVAGVFLGSAIVFLGVFVMEKYLAKVLNSAERVSSKILNVLRVPILLGSKQKAQKETHSPSESRDDGR
jgi:membrane-associated phospholipid phosphatase